MKVETLLPDFQNFLSSRRLVPKKNLPFYAYWVSKFLDFSNYNQEMTLALRRKQFLNLLKNQKDIKDWQVRQAENALLLYFDNFFKVTKDVKSSGLSVKNMPNLNIIPLITKVIEAIRIKHYSYRTERSYVDWVKRFYNYLNHSKGISDLDKVTSTDLRDFLSYLAIHKRVSSSTQNQAFNALLFLFREVLDIEVKDVDKAVRAKRGLKLPVVLTVEEVEQLFMYLKGKALLIAQLLYGSGLRLMELARLRVQDIDFSTNQIFIRSAKGDKDRITMLAERAKESLQNYLIQVKTLHEKDLVFGQGEVYLPDALSKKYVNAAKEWRWQYVFPANNFSTDPRTGKIRRHHISEKSIQLAINNAAKKAKMTKRVTVHTLRHSFATHLLMNGTNIREIQDLLGHKNLETTMIYTHVLRNMTDIPKSPLDNLFEKVNLSSKMEKIPDNESTEINKKTQISSKI